MNDSRNDSKPAVHGAVEAGPRRQLGALRRPALILATLVFLTAGLAAFGYWFFDGRFYEDTDDAYVNGRIVTITPQAGGTVVAVGADETDTVHAGQLLARLDPADARIELMAREAQLAQAVRDTRARYANDDVLESRVKARETDLERAQDDLQRRRSVRDTGVVSKEEIRHAELAVSEAKDALATARNELFENRSYTSGTEVRSHPAVLAAAARVRETFLALRRDEIVAPVGGQIARRNVQVGQRVTPGTPIMSLVPMENLWVDANFKEVQLQNIRIGQPAKIVADVYGSSVTYDGTVIGLGAGTGSAFALLPAQNATGNWIKVVQRVPVRIALDPKELRAHPLRVGLSIRATVDVHRRDGALVSTHNDSSPDNRTEVYNTGEREADTLVARIIASNNAPTTPAQAGIASVAAP